MPWLKLSLTNYRVITVDMKKVLYILNLNFNNKKRNLVNCDGDSYGFLDDKESLDFIRAEARLGQNLKNTTFLGVLTARVGSSLHLPIFIGCWWLWAGGRCWCWCWCRLLGEGG